MTLQDPSHQPDSIVHHSETIGSFMRQSLQSVSACRHPGDRDRRHYLSLALND